MERCAGMGPEPLPRLAHPSGHPARPQQEAQHHAGGAVLFPPSQSRSHKDKRQRVGRSEEHPILPPSARQKNPSRIKGENKTPLIYCHYIVYLPFICMNSCEQRRLVCFLLFVRSGPKNTPFDASWLAVSYPSFPTGGGDPDRSLGPVGRGAPAAVLHPLSAPLRHPDGTPKDFEPVAIPPLCSVFEGGRRNFNNEPTKYFYVYVPFLFLIFPRYIW